MTYHPTHKDVRAGTNVTVVEDARGFIVSASGGSGTFSGGGVTTVVDFGSDSDMAVATVTGQTWVTPTSVIVATLGEASSDHDVEDGLIEGITFLICNRVNGVGFDVYAHAPNGTFGQYNVNCTGV